MLLTYEGLEVVKLLPLLLVDRLNSGLRVFNQSLLAKIYTSTAIYQASKKDCTQKPRSCTMVISKGDHDTVQG